MSGVPSPQQSSVTLHFSVAYPTKWGQTILLTGSGALLGGMQWTHARQLSCHLEKDAVVWEATIVLPWKPCYTYKYALVLFSHKSMVRSGGLPESELVGPAPGETVVRLQALSCALELLSSLPSASPAALLEEADAAFRCLLAVGTLLVAGGQDLCQIAKDLDINDRIHTIMTAARGGGEAEKKLLQAGIDVASVIARSTGVKVEGL
ncbi:hypothetical protein TSOC_003889 [Tetrabaena socialis]|uniref:CBM20 domain-containing protein n=1 Tax=Tetrabaena socialis TaxID=47790 RepID=A0A2J8AAD3_9CHLO|nr:hypothetical protein TSOC_003889 [Tetrabaena socialis]|eukprot:PNH09471.1 hypothetical protein TSOC_003889 [Tetrabaena socialis]